MTTQRQKELYEKALRQISDPDANMPAAIVYALQIFDKLENPANEFKLGYCTSLAMTALVQMLDNAEMTEDEYAKMGELPFILGAAVERLVSGFMKKAKYPKEQAL